ncbi:LAME_0F03246g1_1 [Lachancea meyersii CBS 8951]|uniref:non-specific serine/threonine protein kinase n=1 Tax=Lachancea meyersii CBS 8951 TaxID=1266667 RepID=A0A1G4JR48_9SACH|nr:LAME_0F03246g1_1 [Lachancea meyersii CBS 8951]
MGSQLSLIAHTAPSIAISSYIDILDEVHYLSQLNSSRFLKTCKALDPNGEVLIKVFIKPSDDYSLVKLQTRLVREAQMLAQLPNALNYSKIVESDRAGYLIRQHLKSSVYDRLSTRPFLEIIELKFIVFQLLRALDDIHSRGVCHGDLKLENLLLTSWNWLVVTDFSENLKPTYLPEDNPGDYSFYFDTSQRRTCYLAPERFDSSKYQMLGDQNFKLTLEMDVFSAGCCIAEIFSEGNCIFNLSQLFRYQNGEYNPQDFLNSQVEDPGLREMILGMISLDPHKRSSIRNILQGYRGTFFPEHFYHFYYDYFTKLATIDGGIPPLGNTFGTLQLSNLSYNMDKVVQRIYKDLPKICSSLDYPIQKEAHTGVKGGHKQLNQLSLPGLGTIRLQGTDRTTSSVVDESSLLLLSLLLHAIRAVKSSSVKIMCLELFVVLSQYVSDSNRLDRVIPFVVSMLSDEHSTVQALAVHVLSQILGMTKKVNRINELLFTDYLLPRLKKLTQVAKHSDYVRMALAEELGEIATTASRFNDAVYSHEESSGKTLGDMEFAKKQKRKLIHGFEEVTVTLLTDSQASVKIALLSNILPLCSLFGREKANDVVLSHLITYLNDKNASLRIQLIKSITGIAVLLGPLTLEQYILPLLVQTVTDSEELVVVMILKSLKTLFNIGLVQKKYSFDVAKIVSPLLLHPNNWIRQFTLSQLVEISSKLSRAEVYCLLYPIIKPYFEFDVQLTWDSMLSSCKRPLSRTVYNLLCTWSLRSSNSLFWKQVPSKHRDLFGNNSAVFINKDYVTKNYGLASGYKIAKTPIKLADNKEILVTNEDKSWLEKIMTVGLKDSDLWKIAAMRSYTFSVAKMLARKPDANAPDNAFVGNGSTSKRGLSSYTPPRNVIFDVMFINNGAQLNESQHRIVKHSERIAQPLTTAFHRLALNRSIDLTKSIQLTKAAPTLTSNLDNVYVQLEGSKLNSQGLQKSSSTDSEVASSMFAVKNSYEGNDANIKSFLNSIDVEPPFKYFPEFGHLSGARSTVVAKTSGKAFSRLKFCFQLTENRSSIITVVAASPHDPYILTGSDDGTIKLWNIPKILSGEIFGSSFCHDAGSTIMDIKAFPGFDLFAAACKDGNVIILKVNVHETKSARVYTRLQVIRKFKMKRPSEHVTRLAVVASDDNPLLVALSNHSDVILLDPRFMSETRRIKNDPLHGAVLSFAMGHDKSSIILGTSRGVIDIWDVRFGTLVSSWTFSDGSPITHLSLYPLLARREEHNIAIVGGSSKCDFTIWNYVTRQCRQIVMNSGVVPPISEYLAASVDADRLRKPMEQILPGTVSSIVLEGTNILISEARTNCILCFDPREKTMMPLTSATGAEDSIYNSMQLTANTTVMLKQKLSIDLTNRKESLHLHNDTISFVTVVRNKTERFLVSSDRSGIMNIYN